MAAPPEGEAVLYLKAAVHGTNVDNIATLMPGETVVPVKLYVELIVGLRSDEPFQSLKGKIHPTELGHQTVSLALMYIRQKTPQELFTNPPFTVHGRPLYGETGPESSEWWRAFVFHLDVTMKLTQLAERELQSRGIDFRLDTNWDSHQAVFARVLLQLRLLVGWAVHTRARAEGAVGTTRVMAVFSSREATVRVYDVAHSAEAPRAPEDPRWPWPIHYGQKVCRTCMMAPDELAVLGRKLRRCQTCSHAGRRAYYCSTECQRQDRPAHKTECGGTLPPPPTGPLA
jgi:hypothetical protein